jgi:hypothetical protein
MRLSWKQKVFIVFATNRSLIRSNFSATGAGKREYSPRLLELHVALPSGASAHFLHDQAPFPDDLFRMISTHSISSMRRNQLRPLGED